MMNFRNRYCHGLRLTLVALCCLVVTSVVAQVEAVRAQLDSLSYRFPNLNNPVEINVEGIEVSALINGLSQSQGLNLGVAPEVNGIVTHVFSDVKVKDVLLFLSEEYRLLVKTYGDIIYLYPKPAEKPTSADPYDYLTVSGSGLIDIEAEGESVSALARAINKKAGVNVIVAPDANNKELTFYLKGVTADMLLDKVALLSSNELAKDSASGIFYINKSEKAASNGKPADKTGKNRRPYGNSGNQPSLGEGFSFELQDGRINIRAADAPVQQVIGTVATDMAEDFVFLDDMNDARISMQLEDVDFETFLKFVLSGTKYRYVNMDGAYVVGTDEHLNINSTRFFKFQNRTYQNVLDAIPANLKEGLEVSEFAELNGLIINGNVQLIKRLVAFLESIDQRVPMVTIDILIVDYNTSRTTSTGISMGFGPQGDNVRSQGMLSPGVDVSLNSSSINKILSSFEKVGLFNLGRVTPDFYFNLKLLESQGVLKTRSTPKITTLNGQEASLSLGRTEYYLEIRNDIIGSQNPTVSSSQSYRSVNADLTVRIKPVISSDGQVTLEVNVNQSDFTNRINENAPPGTVSRSFESIIRVTNDDMIILGGLEDITKDKSGSGIPLLSRIPILKYLFSSRDDTFQKSKLNIFIKPTIYY